MTDLHALITGGSSGIGRALACRLAARGYDLSLIARREALLNDAAAEIRRHFSRPGQRLVTCSADVADAAQAETAVKTVIDKLGAPDLLVTSAGIAHPGHFDELPLATHQREMQVNYFGTLHVVRAALPAMRARRRGRLVLVSSGAGLMGIFGYAAYSPTKFAVRGLAECLRAELRADNVAVSVVFPPDTETPQLEEENKIKPEETKLMTGIVRAWSADAVAQCIVRGVERGAFAITPGFVIGAMYRIGGFLVPLLHWHFDRLAAGVRRRMCGAAAQPVAGRP